MNTKDLAEFILEEMIEENGTPISASNKRFEKLISRKSKDLIGWFTFTKKVQEILQELDCE